MRNLTIKREKSFVGCLMKATIYVHDELTGDTKINGDKCYKLGVLKNGEEKTFTIGDEETKIYVVGDKLSRNLTNEVCYIPAGYENVYLMGECKYNPFGGNIFRFHGMTDPRVLANRKKSTKKFGVFLAICCVLGGVFGFFSAYDAPVYAKDGEPLEIVDDSGVVMTLTDSFEKLESDGYNFTYGTNDAVVFGMEERFADYKELKEYSLEEYGESLIEYWEVDSKLQKADGIMYFEYQGESEDTNTVYHYLVSVYKTEDSFWAITFAIDDANYETYKPLFIEWAKSVAFVEE